ncbi:hypothetical protein UNDKW_5952 (plasmid) [Undibacterium sp. KW1]|uniref:hypothetical protein n=1 Tax=Undibacterium sp. KW1 TaxID=2058624 RepID=UPI001331CC64|nr:hypothetical protein [Undibacterium sp. KW1]BBB64225.1 hypothetical protein UNDKW_5952 [Undibacterium sp. KW1]
MIAPERLIAAGFKKRASSDGSAQEFLKTVPVKFLSKEIRDLFKGTDVNDSDIATVWIEMEVGVGISVWDCNAHYGTYSFEEPLGRLILQGAGL